MKNQTIPSVIAIIVLVVGTYWVLQRDVPAPTTSPAVPAGEITVSGEITCLPKVGRGAQTMECAIGLQDDDGLYYGLRNLSDHGTAGEFMDTSIRVEVSGELVHEEIFGPDGNRYNTVGVIEITSIQKI